MLHRVDIVVVGVGMRRLRVEGGGDGKNGERGGGSIGESIFVFISGWIPMKT